jgi:hypothetical protein
MMAEADNEPGVTMYKVPFGSVSLTISSLQGLRHLIHGSLQDLLAGRNAGLGSQRQESSATILL